MNTQNKDLVHQQLKEEGLQKCQQLIEEAFKLLKESQKLHNELSNLIEEIDKVYVDFIGELPK